MSRLVLWDVDRTLIDNGWNSIQVYRAAFHAVTGQIAVVQSSTEGGPTFP